MTGAGMGNVSATLDVYILVRYVLEYDIIEQIISSVYGICSVLCSSNLR